MLVRCLLLLLIIYFWLYGTEKRDTIKETEKGKLMKFAYR